MSEDSDDLRKGPHQARAYLAAARFGGQELLDAAENKNSAAFRHHSIGFFGALYAAIQALKVYDGENNSAIKSAQATLWPEIKQNSVYKIICDERHALSRGGFLNDGTPSALEPSWVPTLFRHMESGRGLSGEVFDEWRWPDGEHKGKALEEIVYLCWKAVSDWIDVVDAESQSQ